MCSQVLTLAMGLSEQRRLTMLYFVGNARFRDLVGSLLDEYSTATSKLEKSAIVQRVLVEVRSKSPNGGFIKKDPLTGQWYEVCTSRKTK